MGGKGRHWNPIGVNGRRMEVRNPRRGNLAAIAVLVGVLGGCAASPATSELPRTTAQGIRIALSVSEEVLPSAGCHTQWLMQHDEEPPPGTCEQAMTVRRYHAERNGDTVEATVVGDGNVDPLYSMGLAARESTESISIFVVTPPTDAEVVRITDGAGEIVDEVASSEGLVALAGLGPDLTPQAIAADGSVIASCPPAGVLIEDVVFECTLAPDAVVPVTTTVITDASR